MNYNVLLKLGNTRSISMKRIHIITVRSSSYSHRSAPCRMNTLAESASPSTESNYYQIPTPSIRHLTKLASPYGSSNASTLRKVYLKIYLSRLKPNGQHQLSLLQKKAELPASRKLNILAGRKYYSMQRIEKCIDSLGKATTFSTHDVNHGNWQVKKKDKNQDMTAFISHHGLKRTVRMLLFWQNASKAF